MEKIITKEAASVLYRIGIYQIAGGLLGLVLILWNSSTLFQSSVWNILLFIIITLLFIYSVVCGVMCIKKNSKALPLSFANQLLQSIGFAIGGYAFSYVSGIYCAINLDFTDSPGLSFSIGISRCFLNINTDDAQSMLSFNLIGIWVFYEVLMLINKVKEDTRERQINSIGQN